MAELPELQRYSMETTEQMLAYDGQFDSASIIMLICEAIDLKSFREGEESISSEERVVDAVWSLETEVMNGGFGQFFCNTSGMYAPTIVDALRKAGCPRCAKVTQVAIDAFQIPEVTVEAIQAAIKRDDGAIEEALAKCGDDFVAAREDEDLISNLLAFVGTNREVIRLV